ncbi:MAG: SCO family protein [Gammaproteobacteria bacterium]|nr:SCO family protein [Gammaproteobacteria bacterium]
MARTGIYALVSGLVVVALLIVSAQFASKEPPPPVLPAGSEGIVIENPPEPVPQFAFYDQDGKKFTEQAFKGKWSLWFFGYTNCPDVCPTSMMVMNQVAKYNDLPDTQFVFTSVDPKRDKPAALKEFVTHFNPKFIGTSGEKAEIDKFVETFGVVYGFEGDTNTDDYVVTHFGAIYIIGPKGVSRAYVLPPHDYKRVLDTYLLVRNHYEKS